MKNLFSNILIGSGALAVATILTGCAASGPDCGGVSGTFDNAAGETVYLERLASNKFVRTDSAVVDQSGNFSILPAPALEFDYYRLILGSGESILIVTDSTENLSLKADAADLTRTAQVSGSQHTALLVELSNTITPLKDKVQSESESMRTQGKSFEELNQIKTSITDTKKEIKQSTIAFIKANPGSPATLTALRELSLKTDVGFYDKVLNETKDEFGHSIYYKLVQQQTANAKQQANVAAQQQQQRGKSKYSVGMEAPNISMNNPDGSLMSLADLRGKVVLLDFWASWCGPCRRENPHVVHSYEKYNKDGFEVFSVSLDRSVDPWKKAIEQDGLMWPYHVSDLKGWQSDAAALYGVHSIPHAMLLDRDGTVLGTNLRGPVLTSKLEEIFGH